MSAQKGSARWATFTVRKPIQSQFIVDAGHASLLIL
jgi:hypothetical protein